LIPGGEEDVHEASADCACSPSLVPEERKENAPDWLVGATAFEHHPFSPGSRRMNAETRFQ
jgi:hypothetical protein